MKINKYESPEITVININEDIITASIGSGGPGETPKEDLEW